MQSFKTFIVEGRGKMTASGQAGEEHLKKYVQPFLGSKEFTHTLATEHEDLPAGSRVKLKSVERINGKIHVKAEDETGNEQLIPISKMHKPGEAPPNKGHDYETKFVDRLKKHGIMPHHILGAGSTSGTDFAIENKKKNSMHHGTVSGSLLNGETKDGVTAAMGQLTIHHNKEKGWHIVKNEMNWLSYTKFGDETSFFEFKVLPNPMMTSSPESPMKSLETPVILG